MDRMLSEWLQIMLAEIARKTDAAEHALQEAKRRQDEGARAPAAPVDRAKG
jgi:hypothetical protein